MIKKILIILIGYICIKYIPIYIYDIIIDYITSILNYFINIIQRIKERIPNFIQNIINWIIDYINYIYNCIKFLRLNVVYWVIPSIKNYFKSKELAKKIKEDLDIRRAIIELDTEFSQTLNRTQSDHRISVELAKSNSIQNLQLYLEKEHINVDIESLSFLNDFFKRLSNEEIKILENWNEVDDTQRDRDEDKENINNDNEINNDKIITSTPVKIDNNEIINDLKKFDYVKDILKLEDTRQERKRKLLETMEKINIRSFNCSPNTKTIGEVSKVLEYKSDLYEKTDRLISIINEKQKIDDNNLSQLKNLNINTSDIIYKTVNSTINTSLNTSIKPGTSNISNIVINTSSVNHEYLVKIKVISKLLKQLKK